MSTSIFQCRGQASGVIVLFLLLGAIGTAEGQMPGQRDFDIVSVTLNQFSDATGSSNGVGWMICNTFFSGCCGSSTNGSYTGFNTDDFDPPVAASDAAHTGGYDFKLVFEEPVNSVVFYLRNNPGDAGGGSLDFGIPPIVVSGGDNLTIVGTRVQPNTEGGAVRFDDIDSKTLTNTVDIVDGISVAWYVEELAADAGPLTGIGDPCPSFVRGDVDADGVFNALADGVYLLTFGFVGGPPPPCLEAADADGNTTLNALSDTLFILTYGFVGGPPPPTPFPECGSDPDPASSLGCDLSPCP